MSKTIREHISNTQVEKSNLQHIAETGKINGSLLISIEKIIQDYSQYQTQELQEQNAELVEILKSLLKHNDITRYDRTMITELLIKYNHLNKK